MIELLWVKAVLKALVLPPTGPLLVAALGVFVQRGVYLFGAHQEAGVFTAAITKLVEVGDWERAIRLSGAAKTPLGRITQQGLMQAAGGARAFQAGMDEAALRELPALRRHIDAFERR